jgi:hypothetical protein
MIDDGMNTKLAALFECRYLLAEALYVVLCEYDTLRVIVLFRRQLDAQG